MVTDSPMNIYYKGLQSNKCTMLESFFNMDHFRQRKCVISLETRFFVACTPFESCVISYIAHRQKVRVHVFYKRNVSQVIQCTLWDNFNYSNQRPIPGSV